MLNIAYNVGAFTPTLFTMMVLMALITTMSTAPVLNLLGIRESEALAETGVSNGAPLEHPRYC